MYLWWESRGMRGVTLYMSPSSREEGNGEKVKHPAEEAGLCAGHVSETALLLLLAQDQ